MNNYKNMMEIGFMEIDVITESFDNSMIDLYNASEIEDSYMTESVGDIVNNVKEFFEKLIKNIKELISKIKKKITDKINDIKVKSAIKKITHAGIKNNKKIVSKGNINVKALNNYANKMLKKSEELVQKVSKTKTQDEIDKLCEEYKYKSALWETEYINELESNEFITFQDLQTLVKSDLFDLIEEDTVGTLNQLEKIQENYTKNVTETEKKDEKTNAKNEDNLNVKKVGNAIISSSNKCINHVGKHKIAAISIISGLAAVIGGKKIVDKVKR